MPETHSVENEINASQARDLLMEIRSEAVAAAQAPLRLFKLVIRLSKFIFVSLVLMLMFSLAYKVFSFTSMLYHSPGLVLDWFVGLIFRVMKSAYSLAYSTVVKEPVLPWYEALWNDVLWYVDYGHNWLQIHWKICLLAITFFTLLLWLLVKIKRGFYSFCRRMRGVQYHVVQQTVQREAMVAGSEFSKHKSIPAYQISIELPGAFLDTHIGWGIRVRNYLVTYFHITKGLRSVVLNSSVGKKICVDLALYQRRRSKFNTDLVYYKLDNAVFATIGSTSAVCPDNIFGMDRYVDITGMRTSGSTGVLSMYDPLLGHICYSGSTKAGFSGAAYHQPSAPRLCYGLHNGTLAKGGSNFGTSMLVIESEMQIFEIFDDPAMCAKYLKMLELRRKANDSVLGTPESSRKVGQYGRTGYRITGRKSNGHFTYDNSDYDAKYDETGGGKARDRRGRNYDEQDVRDYARNNWQDDEYDQDFDEDYSTEITTSWAEYRNQFDSIIATYSDIVGDGEATSSNRVASTTVGEANCPRVTISSSVPQVPFAIQVNPHVGGDSPSISPRVAKPLETQPLHEYYLQLEGRVRQLEHRLEQVNATFKRLNIRQCNLCSYAAPHTIAKHLREVHGEAPLSLLKNCEHCNHKFDAEALRVHKCFKCERCGKRCSQEGLKEHAKLCPRNVAPRPLVDKPSTSAQAKSYAAVVGESAIATDFVEQVATSSVPFLEQRNTSAKRTKRRSKKPSRPKVSEPSSSSTEALLAKMLESQQSTHKLLEQLVRQSAGQRVADKPSSQPSPSTVI